MGNKIKNAILGPDVWDPTHRFETSWFLSPWVLFACRVLMCLYIFVVRFYIIGWHCSKDQCDDIGDEFSYFTVLCYWALGVYFIISAVHTATYAATGRSLLHRSPRFLQEMHYAFYTTIVVFPFIVTISYWALLFDGSWFPTAFEAFRQLSQHLLNAVFALFEILVPRVAGPPWIHILVLWVLLGMYTGLAYVTVHTKGFYPYSYLDPGPDGAGSPGYVAAYIVGIFVIAVIIFCVVKALLWFKRWLTETKLGLTGKFSRHGAQGHDVEMSAVSKEHH